MGTMSAYQSAMHLVKHLGLMSAVRCLKKRESRDQIKRGKRVFRVT